MVLDGVTDKVGRNLLQNYSSNRQSRHIWSDRRSRVIQGDRRICTQVQLCIGRWHNTVLPDHEQG